MKLYYRDFLLFVGETNGSIRERLLMEDEKCAGEKEYKEGAKLLRAFVLSNFDLSAACYLDEREAERKLGVINKTKLEEEYSSFPLKISEKRKAFFLENEENYKDILFPSDFDAWNRIKKIGERSKWGQLKMKSSPLFDTEELFLSKESYLKIIDVQHQSCLV